MSLLAALSLLIAQITASPVFQASAARQVQAGFWLECVQVGDNEYDCDGGQL